MTKIHFRPYIPNQTVLFPQRIDEDIAENDPVRMVDALVSGLLHATSFRPVQTRSRFASGTEYLKLATYNNSPDRSTKSTSSPINGL